MQKTPSTRLIPNLDTVRSVPTHLDRMLRFLIHVLGITVSDLDSKLQETGALKLRKVASLSPFSLYIDNDAETSTKSTRQSLSAKKQATIIALTNDSPITIKHFNKVVDMLPNGEWEVASMTCTFKHTKPDGTIETIVVDTDKIAKYLDQVRDGNDVSPPIEITTTEPPPPTL